MRLTSRLVLGPLLAVALSAAPARAEDWATPGLDAAHARLSAERSGALFADGRWTATGGGRILSSPVVADGLVVTVDLGGVVRTLRADDGQLAWQVSLGSAVQGTPAIARGRVFVPTLGNQLVALRLADGAPLWTLNVDGMILSSPAPVNDDVVLSVGFPQRHLVRVSGITGEVIWRSPPVIEPFGNSSPAIGGGLAVVGSNSGRLYAFDLVTGLLRWEYAGDGIVHLAAPLIWGGHVYLAGGGDSDHVHAVDAASGTAVAGWPIELPAPAPDIAGTRIGRRRAVSSFAAAGGLLLLQTRLDDMLDTNSDGAADRTLAREAVLGIDPSTGGLVWQHALARAEITDPNNVPKFFICPTPAAFSVEGDSPLAAVASSLQAAVVVLDVASGGERARHTVAGPALASPLMANGRLLVAPMNGSVQGLGSSVNRAPGAPVLAANPRPIELADLVLRWLPSVDPEGDLPSYELRIDGDGELLQSWQQQLFLSSGTSSAPVTTGLVPGGTYTWSVRARDSRGALSGWSAPETFTVANNPAVTIGGTPAVGLKAALAAAQPGDVVVLGAGRFTLSDTLRLRAGVTLQGAGAGQTILDAAGLPAGISVEGAGARVVGLTVSGADRCIYVAGGSTDVHLSHLIARDCRTEGVVVQASAGAELVNTTLVRNGTAVRAAAATKVRNSLLSGNGLGLSGDAAGVLTSSYNDLFDNRTNYAGLSAGPGDLSTPVSFADLAGGDLRLTSAQPSTDKGDPADAVGDEPAPNGGRINLGAFGGTADAEPSAESTTNGGTGSNPSPGADSPPPREHPPAEQPPANDSGCAVGGGGGAGWWTALAIAALALRRVRRRRAA